MKKKRKSDNTQWIVIGGLAAAAGALFWWLTKPAVAQPQSATTPMPIVGGVVNQPAPAPVAMQTPPSGIQSMVVADRSFFYDSPSTAAMRPSKPYVIKGDVVTVTQSSGDFSNVWFQHHAGAVTTGWLLKSTLAQ